MAKKQFNATGGLSVGNIISPISVIDANGVINTPANITGNYYFGNGAFLTGINAGNIEGSYGNANVAAYLASNSNIDIAIGTGNITTRGNVSADYFIGNGAGLTAIRASGNNFQVQYNKNNLLSADNQFYYDDANAGALYINYTGGGSLWTDDIISSNSVTALGPASIGGNVVTFENFVGNGYYITALEYSNINNAYSNTNAAAYLASNANVTIITTGNIVTAANVSANYVIGNGAFLTGLAAGYSNADVANYLASNANINILIGTGNVTTQGNVAANNFVGTAGSNIELIAGSSTWTFDNTGNLTLPSNSVDIYYANGDPINLEGNYSNANAAAYLGIFNGNILAGNLEVSNNAVINGNLTVLGTTTTINANTLNISDKDIVIANGATTQAQANGAGLIIGSNIANILYSDVANAMIFSGNVTTAANIQAGYVLGNGRFLSGLPEAYSNANVAAYLPTYTGNISAGNINATGNISANYFIGNGSQLTDLIATANLTVSNTAPLNATQGDLWIQANTGIQYFYFTTPAGNSQWAEMEAATSFSSSSAEGNGNYGNSNVANYLPTYTGNVSAGNVLVTSNVNLGGNINLTNLDSTDWGRIFTGNSGIDSFLALEIGDDAPGQADKIVLQSHYWVNNTRTQMLTAQMVSNTSANVSITGNVVASENVYANANVQGDYILGNGYYLTGISGGGGSYGNANVAAYLASNANVTITTTGAITTNGNLSASIVRAGNIYPVYSNGVLSNNVVDIGSAQHQFRNIYANAIVTPGGISGNTTEIQGSTTGSGVAFVDSGSGALADISAGDSSFTGNVSADGFIQTDLYIQATGNIISGGNVSGTYILGNGYFLTGVGAGAAYGNSNVAAYLPTYTGAINSLTGNVTTTANVQGAYVLGNGAFLTGISGGSGNYSNANVAAYLPTYTGTVGATTVTATGNVNGDNINGVIRPTAGSGEAGIMFPTNIGGGSGDSANIKYYVVTGQDTVLELQVTDNSADKIYLNASGGTNVATSLNVSGGITGTTINGTTVTGTSFVGNGSALFGVKYANITGAYGNSNVAAYLPDYTGNLNINGLTVSGIANLGPAGNVKISGGNLNYYLTSDGSGGLAWAAGTSNITGNGSVAGADQQIQYNNGTGNFAASAALRFDYTSNTLIVGGNLSVANINATGNIFGINEDQVAIAVMGNEWTFTQDAYLNLPVNFFAVRYANGANVILGDTYSNSAVSNYLGSNSSVTILTTGNITGGYILGNGRFLTGITAYTNANVAGYLQTYNANALFGNVTVSQDAIIQGNLTVLGTTNYNNTTNSIIDAYRVIVANSANTISQLNGAGLQIGNLASGNVEFIYDYTANIMTLSHGANIANILNVSGNTSATYFLGNGRFLSGLGENYSNADVSGFLPIYGGNVRADYTISNVIYSGNILPMYSNTTLANSTVDIGSETYFFSNVYGNKFTVPAGAAGNNSAIQSGENYDGFMFVDTVTGQLASLEAGDAYFGNLTIYSDFEIGNNLQVVGNVNCLSNVTAINFIGNGSALFGIQYSNIIGTYSNSNAAAYLPTYTGNLVSLTGNVTTSANIRSNYNIANLTRTGNILPIYSNAVLANNFVDIGSAQYQFRNIYADKLVTPSGVTGNATEIQSSTSGSGIAFVDSGSGQLAAISAGDSSFTGNVEVDGFIQADQYIQATGNIIAGGNVTGSYILGNGAFLTGIDAGNIVGGYGNSQVAAYLQVYNGNASFSNVTVSRDMVVLGNLRVEGNTTEINVSNIFLADKDIIVAANATATLADLDGAGIQIGNRTAGGNITFFYDSTSNVMELSHGANISNRLEVSGNISGSNINGVIRPTAGSGEAGIIFPANPGGGTGDLASIKYYASAGENTVLELNVNNDSTDTIYLNASGGTNVATSLTVAGNIVGSNITTAANISAGNLSVVNIQVTEIDVTGGALTINATGDIVTTGNLQVINIDVNDINVGGNALTINTTGDIVTTGNLQVVDIDVTNINVGSNALTINATGDIVTTGNLQVNNVDVNVINLDQGTITSNVTQVSIAAGNRTWIYENSGNLLLPGNILPGANSNNTLDLGSSGTQFRRVYANNYVTPVGTSGGPTLIQSNPIGSGIALIDFVSGLPTQIYGNGFITPSGVTGNATLIRSSTTGRGISFVDNNTGLLVPISASESILSGNLTANGYILGGNLNIGSGALTINILGDIVTTGNLQVNDIDVNDLVALGNITGTYIFGNGAFLTGISGGSGNYSNANVDSYLASNAAVTILTTANITTAANVSGSYILGNGAFLTGISGGSVNYSNANVDSYLASNAAVTILTTANITTAANVSGSYILGNGAFLTGISAGSNYSNSNVAAYLPTYTGAIDSLGGNVTTTANVTGNFLIGNIRSATGGYNDANVAAYTGALTNLTGNVTTTANVSGAYILGNGYFVSGIQYSNIIGAYSNTNVANYLASNANVTILTTGNITTTANITANNFIGSEVNTSITADAYVWTFNNTGNLVLPSNTFAINYANGTQVSLGGNFSNANVANYLASGSLTSNIITTGNVSGNYILGNGALLTGLPATYSNANVANYLPTYTGNLVSLTGNVTTTANVQGAFLLGNIRSATGGYNDANVTSYLASNANISITVQGNVSANNFTIGSGTLLGNNPNTTITTGSYSWVFSDNGNLVLPGNTLAVNFANGVSITTSLYSNANVANYLPTYTGNLGAGNLNLTGNIVDTGPLRIVTGAIGNIGLAPGNSNVLVVSIDGIDITGTITTENTGTFGNVSTAGTVAATGNVSGGNLISNNTISGITIATTGTGTFGNVSTAGTVTATGNITGGNITTTGFANLGITQVNGNLVVTGNISATGNITYINVSDLVVSDPLLFLAANNPGDTEDIGLVANYNPGGGNLHTGFARDYTDSTWKLFQGVTSDPNTVIAWNEAVYAPFKAGSILSNAAITANGNVTGANFSSAGIVTATGNITGGNIRSNAAITGTTLVVSGNATSGNLIANYVYGDISNTTGGNQAVLTLLESNSFYNITTTGAIQGNTVQAQYFYGNGSLLTGITANFGNSNLVAYGEAGWFGNIIPGANGLYNIGSNSNRWNDVYINSTLYLPFQTLTSNSTRIIASSSISAYDFISTNDITAAANITATGNVSGSYVLGNIRFSTGGYNDANVAAYTGALINLTGNVTTSANVQGAYVLGNIRSATGGYDDANVAAYTGALTNLTGNVTTTANVQGAYVLGNGAFLTGIAAGYSNADVANYLPTYTGALPNLTGNVVTTANVQGGYILGNGYFLSGISGGGGSTYGNANVSDYLASNAAITVLTTANITTAANVAGTYFIGNGAFLTGISAGSSYSNANVADYLASNAAVTITTTANISSSTNVNAGNFSGTGVNTNIRTGSQLWTFGSTGILTIPGNVNANNYYINNLTNPVQDQDAATKIYVDNLASTAISYHEAVLAATTGTLAAATGGTITYNQVNGVGNGIGATLTTTGSFNLIDMANVQTANTRILVKNEANGAHNGVYVWSNATAITRASTENTAGVANVDAFGINDYFYTTGGNINKGSAFIVDAPNTAIVFGTSNIQFAVFSQSQVYSANTAAGISLATTTISAKVDNDTTAFDGGGNISVKAGANLVTPNIGAATGTSLNVTGNITSSANISGANFVGGSSSNTTIRTGIYNWTFGNTGNFTLPGNTFAVNYANGTQVSLGGSGGSYSNADVANYLASNAAVTILTTGNITTSANITANNFIGAAGSDPNVGLIAGTYTWNFDNTGNLTLPGNTFAVNYANGTQVSLYGNSNVATYLASNAAVTVLTTANITTAANVAGNYFIGNGAFLTGIAGGGGSYGNANVAAYLASNAAVTILTTANITSSANVAAGNFVGSASNTTIKTGAYTWTFDQAGNLNINSASGTIVGSNANTTIQTGANRWNFASDGQLYLPGNLVVGYRDIPQNSWTGTPTIALADLGEHYYTASGGVTINIPANSSVPLPIGAAVTLVNQSGANCTIGANAGVTLYLAGNATTGSRILSWYGFATLVKVATDTWFVNGANVI